MIVSQDQFQRVLFFGILGTDRSRTVATNIDLDTKDLQTFGQGDVNFFQNWVLRMKMKRWLKDSKMALTLNELSSGVAGFGSSVWKKVKKDGKVTIVQADLRNLAFDPTVKNINDSDFIIETHYLTELQLRAKKDIWDNVDRAIEVAHKANNEDRDNRTKKAEGTEVEKLEVFERYGEVEIEGPEKNEWKRMHQFVAGEGDEEVILFVRRS